MLSSIGVAVGTGTALTIFNAAQTATTGLVRRGSSFIETCCGERYSKSQKQRLQDYRRLCANYCGKGASLDYFDFDDNADCPVKRKDDLEQHVVRVDNIDAPFNLSGERRRLVRAIDKSLSFRLQHEKAYPLYSPEVYVLHELRKWARGVSIEPSCQLTDALECRVQYAEQVLQYTQDSGAIPKMATLLEEMKGLLRSCREKTKYQEWRSLLPRLHGEASAMHESMAMVLSSVLTCARPAPHGHSTSSSSSKVVPAANSLSVAAELDPENQRYFGMLCDSVRCDHQEIERLNRTLAQYLLVSDGLPLTSISHVDPEVVRTLRQCLSSLNESIQKADLTFQELCSHCDRWYDAKRSTSSIRQWKINYDEIRDDLHEVHSAAFAFTRLADSADSFLLQHQHKNGGGKRTYELDDSFAPQRKKLKAD